MTTYYFDDEHGDLYTREQLQEQYEEFKKDGEIQDYESFEYYLWCCMSINNGVLLTIPELNKQYNGKMIYQLRYDHPIRIKNRVGEIIVDTSVSKDWPYDLDYQLIDSITVDDDGILAVTIKANPELEEAMG